MTVGGHLEYVIALVVDGDGLHPLGLIVLKVALGKEAAGLAGEVHDLVHDLAVVIALAVACSQGLQRGGKVRIIECIACLVGLAVFGEVLYPGAENLGLLLRGGGEAGGLRLPLFIDVHRDAEALPGIADSGSHQLCHSLGAEAAAQQGPGAGRAGHHGGQPAVDGDRSIACLFHLLGRKRHGRHAGAVQAEELAVLGTPYQSKAVTAQAVAGRLHQRQRGGHGHGGVHGVAAGLQDLQAHLGGNGRRGAGHALSGIDHVPVRRKGILQRIKLHHTIPSFQHSCQSRLSPSFHYNGVILTLYQKYLFQSNTLW